MALPTYLTANEKAFNSKVHLAAFAIKDPTKMIDNPASGQKDLPIQDINGVPCIDDPKADPISLQPLKTVATTFQAALSLTTALDTPQYRKGWVNGEAV
jgi:hypothetical protein